VFKDLRVPRLYQQEGPMVTYILQLLAWTAFIAVLLLWPAGTLAYPGAWVFIGLFAAGGFGTVFWLARHSPELLRERMASPLQRAQASWDRIWLSLFMLAFLGWLVVMARDAARTNFMAMPPWLQALGALAILIDFAGTWWTFRENAFAAPVVKVQTNQTVIDTGPYAFVRHPMYTSALFLLVGLPLLLGSWWGLVISVALILAIAWRAVHEERTLLAELPGYEAYSARVRFRFIPLVW
jgi:protein-S-isoprenylcysteine O-methyltransferase Ste14